MGSRLGPGRNPGAFYDRANIEAEGFTTSGGRRTSTGWAAITGGTGIPVAIRELEGMERIRAMQTQSDVTHEVETSIYVEGVTAGQRLKITSDSDRILTIVSAPIKIGRNRRLQLLCSEDVDG